MPRVLATLSAVGARAEAEPPAAAAGSTTATVSASVQGQPRLLGAAVAARGRITVGRPPIRHKETTAGNGIRAYRLQRSRLPRQHFKQRSRVLPYLRRAMCRRHGSTWRGSTVYHALQGTSANCKRHKRMPKRCNRNFDVAAIAADLRDKVRINPIPLVVGHNIPVHVADFGLGWNELIATDLAHRADWVHIARLRLSRTPCRQRACDARVVTLSGTICPFTSIESKWMLRLDAFDARKGSCRR